MKCTVITTNENKKQYWEERRLSSAAADNLHTVNMFPQCRYQTLQGFGGAFTEAAGYTLSRLPAVVQKQVLESYYGQAGLRYTKGRVPLNSCDFSLGSYAACENAWDTELTGFSFSREQQYILPMIKMANQTVGKPIEIMCSPWSPPAFMKTNEDMCNGGKLKPAYETLWARYLARYLLEYRKQGVNVAMLSLQNEPDAVQRWESCIYSAQEEARFVCDHLADALRRAGLADVKIFIWDHNKDILFQRACETFADPKAAENIAGIAFHWYTGDHFDAIRLVARHFPDKELWFSEGCVEYSRFRDSNSISNAEMYAHDILGNLTAGCHGWIDWNLLLDAQGGPNHVQNYCDAPIMATEGFDGVVKHLSYYYIGHFSRYLPQGAVRIATTCYTKDLEIVGFSNPDNTYTLCALNTALKPLPVSVCLASEAYCFTADPHSIQTLVIQPDH